MSSTQHGGSLSDGPARTRRVLVVGTPYDVPGDSVREVRAAALQAHGILNYKQEDEIDRTWEVRDRAGLLLDPSLIVAPDEPLFVHRKAGWGG